MPIDTLVAHYSATYGDQDIGRREIDIMHRARKWSGIGYHYVIRRNGRVEVGRSPETKTGAHVTGHNRDSIGVCVVGGLDRETGSEKGVDNRTPEQIEAQIELFSDILNRHPSIEMVCGHRDLDATQCPAYDVAAWWEKNKGARAPLKKPETKPVPPSAPVVTWPMLKKGSRGANVVMLQNMLKTAGYYKQYKSDGIFGSGTEQAVKDFQRRTNIDVDGLVGPMTWGELAKWGNI